jgi:hypothetical protein
MNKGTKQMQPIKYELLIENGIIYLRGYAKECVKGYFNAEAHPYKNGNSLPSVRNRGEKLAKFHGVNFYDKTK